VSCLAGSAQELWLKSDLAATTASALAFCTPPRYNGGIAGPEAAVNDFWQDLYGFGADSF